MAGELKQDYTVGYTLYSVIRNAANLVWYISGQVFEAWGTGARDADDYDIALTGDDGGRYGGNFDTNIAEGEYTYQNFVRVGGSAADGDPMVGGGDMIWTGSAEITLATSVAAILDDTGTSGVLVADGAISATTLAANTIAASKIATDAINADALAADALVEIKAQTTEALSDINLDHLLKTTTGVAADGDLSNHVVDGTVMSHVLAAGADTSDYKASTDSLEALSIATAAISGPGAIAVTVTIRTTTGTPIEGAKIWVNDANDSTGSVTQAQYTNGSGEIVVNLEYNITYYVFGYDQNYTFAITGNSITPVSGTTSFTLDLGTLVIIAASSYFTTSFLARGIAEIRQNLDEPSLDAKYSDSELITKLEQGYATVIGEVNRNAENPAVGRYNLTYSSGTEIYQLPYHIGMVYAVYTLESPTGTKIFYDSRGRLNVGGRFVWMEGHTLRVQPNAIGDGTVFTIEFVPKGTALLHNGSAEAYNSDQDEITLAAAPTTGTLDTTPEGYVGSIFRVLAAPSVAGYAQQERVIIAYNNATRVATLDDALDVTLSGTLYYEIAPCIPHGLDHVIALYCSMWIASIEGHVRRASQLRKIYANAIRTVRLDAYYSKLDESGELRRDGYDSRRYMRKG